MILDEVLDETTIMNSLNEDQQEYVIDAYAAGYIAALESYIETIEEIHASLPKDVVDEIKSRAQKRLIKAREALRKSKEIPGLKNSAVDTAKDKFNKAYRHLANVNDKISQMRKHNTPAVV